MHFKNSFNTRISGTQFQHIYISDASQDQENFELEFQKMYIFRRKRHGEHWKKNGIIAGIFFFGFVYGLFSGSLYLKQYETIKLKQLLFQF